MTAVAHCERGCVSILSACPIGDVTRVRWVELHIPVGFCCHTPHTLMCFEGFHVVPILDKQQTQVAPRNLRQALSCRQYV